MKTRNLLLDPCWQANDLGQPLPISDHAVSVALPRWEDVIAYEEKKPQCIKALKAVYPRFGFSPSIAEIAYKALKLHGEDHYSCWPYPNTKSAQRAKFHCQKINQNCVADIYDFEGIKCLIVDPEATPLAKAFWQHTGLGASSRQAAIALKKESAPLKEDAGQAKTVLLKRLAKIYGCKHQLISLHPSGMAALTTAIESLSTLKGNGYTLQVGFPYVDVLKLPQNIFHGSQLLTKASIKEIEATLNKRKPIAVIVELPSNPMLECIDLIAISHLAHEKGIPVIADDTIGSPINIDALPYADLVFSSLTKSFAGRGDILAGGLVISPYSNWAKELSEIIPKVNLATLSDPDAIALEQTSRDVEIRLHQLNDACLTLKRKLETLKEISRVLHPESCSNFRNLQKPDGGFGCLLSFELKGGLEKTKRVYNALRVNKGPSLGTNFTLVCPYVLLAHYKELPWAASCGVPSHLLRVSVGLEEPMDLWERFLSAIKK